MALWVEAHTEAATSHRYFSSSAANVPQRVFKQRLQNLTPFYHANKKIDGVTHRSSSEACRLHLDVSPTDYLFNFHVFNDINLLMVKYIKFK